MSEIILYQRLILAMLLSAVAVFVALFFTAAPYGRHVRTGWGPTVGNRPGWVVMESAAAVVFLLCYIEGSAGKSITALVFLAMWEIHYVHRAFIFPFSLRPSSGRMAILVVGLGFLFNSANAYLNGRQLFEFSHGYPASWLLGQKFLIGILIFVVGFVVNRQSDRQLRRLRGPGEVGYRIPTGGLYRWISCPNYCGEIMIWSGWAIATWSLPGLVFAIWTAANLVPRARSHQRWYREHFPEYPTQRKALIPLLW